MSDFQQVIEYSKQVIGSHTSEAGNISRILGANMATVSAMTTANQGVFVPILISYPVTIVKMFWVNGSTVGNNTVDVGIYDSEGNLLVSIGPTTTSGATGVQSVDITDTLLLPGLYYFAFSVNGTTDTFYIGSHTAPMTRAMGVYSQTSVSTLPATATFVGSVEGRLPIFGGTVKTVI